MSSVSLATPTRSGAPADGTAVKAVVYVAENALSYVQGGGVVASHVLKGLPADKVVGFYGYKGITVSPEYGDRFHLLPPDWRPPAWWGRVEGGLRRAGLARTAWRMKQALVRRHPEPFLAEDLRDALAALEHRGFRPEIVYTAPLSLRFLALAVGIARHFDVPMAVLHMDDWLEEDSKTIASPTLREAWRQRIIALMREAGERSLASTTNSPHLAEKLTEVTGQPFFAANNACPDLVAGDTGRLFQPRPAAQPGRRVPLLTYAGAMNLHLQGETLLWLARAVSELNFEGTPCRLEVFTPIEFAPLINAEQMPDVVVYRGHAGPDRLLSAYLASDFLVASTTFRPENLVLFRYSLATKLSEYLCVGKPVLSIGHPDWAVHDYVRRNECGFAVTERERIGIKAQLRQILATPPERLDAIGRANRTLWERQHDIRIMSHPTREAIGLPPL